MDIITLFCDIDECCIDFEPACKQRLLHDGIQKRTKPETWWWSEVMTMMVWFHGSGYRTFKDYYNVSST